MRSIPNNEGLVVIDTKAQRVQKGGEEVRLSAIEYRLLEYLAINRFRILPPEMILERVWGYPEAESSTAPIHLLHTTVGRLRRRLNDHAKVYIITRHGLGYMVDWRCMIGDISYDDEGERLI